MEKREMGIKIAAAGILAILLLVALPLVLADTPFPGYFEVIPSCLSTLTCGQGPNITVNGTGIVNLLAAPANGAADGLVTGVPVNVTWETTTDGSSPYPMNSSVWRANSSGHFLLGSNATVSASHRVQIGPFEYSEAYCPSAGCEIRLVVSSCNATSGMCINSSADNSTFSIVVAPSLYNFSYLPASPKTGDLVTLSWNTYSAMNHSATWTGGSAANASYLTGHSVQAGYFNYSENPVFSIRSCSSGSQCELKNQQVNISLSTAGLALSSTSPSTAITASWTTHNSSNGTLFFSVNGGAVQNSTDGSFSTGHSAALGSFAAGDSITYYARSCLLPNNCETTANATATISATLTTTIPPATTTVSTGGGGSGGFFGGTVTTIPAVAIPAGSEYAYRALPAGLPASFAVNGTSQAIILVTFTHSQYVPNATIVLQRVLSFSGTRPPGAVYQYVNLTHYYVDESKLVLPVKIEFRVSKQWVADSNIDRATISLYRLSGGSWQALETVHSGEDAQYYYFKSNSPGLSLFAITGLSRTAFWDLINLIEVYYAGDPSVDFWKVLDALTAYYSSGGN
ncbi:MAG: PGF-pre-PGF domain-containing protein [archaeon]